MPSLLLMFGQAVRRLRLTAGYSQESFADAIGVHRNYVGTVERGETNITLENIGRIARGLKQPIWVLLREIESSDAAGATDLIAAKARRDVRATAPRNVVPRQVAERRVELREQLVGLLDELSELERTDVRAPRVGRTIRKKR